MLHEITVIKTVWYQHMTRETGGQQKKVLGSRFQLNPTTVIFPFSRGKMIYLRDGVGITGSLEEI